jgi:site-specific recombinase XerD
LLAAASGLRDRTLLLTAYATGLRVSELVSLRVADIDGARQLIRVDHGKGGRDRFVPLFPVLHQALRDYYRSFRPKEWLFPGVDSNRHLDRDTARLACHRARARAGLTKVVTPHTLRRCFATHLHENGVDLLTIKVLLGHRSLQTVQLYALVSKHTLHPQRFGMDLLQGLEAPRQVPAETAG